MAHSFDETELAYLIQGAKARNKRCYARLYELYAPRLFRYIRALVQDSVAAEDLTADVFVRLLERVGNFTPAPGYVAGSFTMWIMRIAHNLAVDHMRANPARSQLEEEREVSGLAPLTGIVNTRPIEALDLERALKRLTTDQHTVITLRFQEDLPFAEIAATLGKTEGAVKALQLRALQALAEYMREPEMKKGETRTVGRMVLGQI